MLTPPNRQAAPADRANALKAPELAAQPQRLLPRWGAYVLSGLCLALAWAAQSAVEPLWGNYHPFIFFFVAVFVAIQFGGVRLFALTLLGAAALADWYFLPPRHSLLISGRTNELKMVLFFLISGVMLYCTERIRRALGREQSARAELARHAQALSQSRARFEHLFEQSPAPTWVEDWTALKGWLEGLRQEGVTELRAFLEQQPLRVREALGLVRVLDVNEAAVELTGAKSRVELAESLARLFTNEAYRNFMDVLTGLWDGQSHIEHETKLQRLDGKMRELIVRLDVPRQGAGSELDFANVIVTATDITERKKAEQEREQLVRRLQRALAEVKTLSGLLPICAHCKSIRDDQGYWNQIELYLRRHSNAKFSHGICPECSKKFYPELFSR